MAETDSLKDFDFNKVTKPGKFLKFVAGKPVTIRIFTKDPVIQETEFKNSKGEVNLSTKFCFIVWNFTDEIAQILSATPTMAKTFQRIGNDPDFGSNLQKCDIKISPEGEQLERVYDINVLRHSGNEKEITGKMVAEAQEINLEKDVKDCKGRLSEWQGPVTSNVVTGDISDKGEIEVSNTSDEPINLDDIPFN